MCKLENRLRAETEFTDHYRCHGTIRAGTSERYSLPFTATRFLENLRIGHLSVSLLRTLSLLIVLGLIAGCSVWGEGEPEQNSGSTPEGNTAEERAEDEPNENTSTQLTQSSLEKAVGQMFVVGVGGTEPDYYIEKMIRERNIGGVILHGYNMQNKEQTRTLVSRLQKLSMETPPCMPLIVAVDQEGGMVASAPWVPYQPPAAAVGQSEDPAQARHVAEETGQQLGTAGINTDLAPVVDTGFGTAIGDRSFGDDPELVSTMGTAAIKGFEAAGVISTAKHFPNHGVARVDSHSGLPIVDHDMQTIRSYDLPPFKAAVDAGVPMVMVGHLLYPAIDPEHPVSLSPKAIQLLRDEVGFSGVVITDDLAMEGAKQGAGVAQAAVKAVSAGADMLIISSQPQVQADAYTAVVRAVEEGQISREQINASLNRIYKLKEQYLLQSRFVQRLGSCGSD